MTLLDRISRRAWAAWKPPPDLTVSEWAASNRYLTGEASAEPGLWRNERAPHLVKIMDTCSPHHPAQEITFCSATQTGKTEVCNNFVGYIVDQDPGPALIVQPTVKMAETWSKDRLSPMLRASPALKRKVAATRGSQHTENSTMLHKVFPGGHLSMVGSNAPAGLASRPIRFLILDEIDRYTTTAEGDAKTLADARTETFWNRKKVQVSSPSYDDVGILHELTKCDTLYEWHLACERCKHRQLPMLKHFRWDNRDIDDAAYVCGECGHKHAMQREYRLKLSGDWVALHEGAGLRIGFRMNQFGSSLASWRRSLQKFLDAKGDKAALQVFTNTVLAEAWEEDAERADPNTILARREEYAAEVPQKALMLTAGVDTQDDRFEVYVWGWAQGDECWCVDAIVIYGDPDKSETREQLDKALRATYLHESGARLGISAVCVDSGGHKTRAVYQFCHGLSNRRIVAIKGKGGADVPMIGIKSEQPTGIGTRKVKLWTLGVDAIKSTLLDNLRVDAPGPGYIHVPAGHALFGPEFAAQITGESKRVEKKKGYRKVEFIPTRDAIEASDCWVYGYAALLMKNPNWTQLQHDMTNAAAADEIVDNRSKPIARRRGGYL